MISAISCFAKDEIIEIYPKNADLLPINEQPIESYNLTRQSVPELFKNGVVKFNQNFSFELSENAQPIFVANRQNSDLKVDYGSSSQEYNRPCV